ncbi:MAG: transcription antitermination factor NusB [Kiloniellales bacterium]
MGARAGARLRAVQALYQIALVGDSVEAVVRGILDAGGVTSGAAPEPDEPHFGQIDEPFFEALVTGASREAEALDNMLAGVLVEGWPVERLELLLRLILRAGAFELGHWPEIPARVVVSQYVDIAHAFLDDKQTAMVNGVLDRLAHGLRLEEFGEGAGGSGPVDDTPDRDEEGTG